MCARLQSANIRAELVAVEGRLSTRIDASGQRVIDDVRGSEARLMARMDSVGDRISREIKESEDRMSKLQVSRLPMHRLPPRTLTGMSAFIHCN